MLIFQSIYVLSIVATLIHLYYLPREDRCNKHRLSEVILLYQIIFSLGITSFLAFIGLTFMDEIVAEHLGWPSCPFQQELANVNLAFGVLGIMSIWWRKSFWVATVLGFSIWIFGDGIHHLYDAYVHGNQSPGNTGFVLWTDIAIPIILCGLLVVYVRSNLWKLE